MSDSPRWQDRNRAIVASILRKTGVLWARRDRLITTLAFMIGAITALGAMGFSWLIEAVSEFYFVDLGGYLRVGGPDGTPTLWYWLALPLLPATGAVFVGLITFYFAPEAEGHGVPEVMDAMARQGGRIRPRVAAAKAVASSLTIGSGGAAGTEGPIIQIGAAIGSGFGQWLRMNLNDIRVLIGAGAAAGIAAIFNAPIAGVLFAVEVLLRDVSLRSFVPIIIAAVLSSTVTQAVKGQNEAIFPVPTDIMSGEAVYEFTVGEFANYLVLGLLCGLAAVTLIKLLYFSEDAFRKLPVHRILRPVTGALMLGVLAVGTEQLLHNNIPHVAEHEPPAVMGNGYPVIEQTLEPEAYHGDLRWSTVLLLVLMAGKLLAVCFTLGSGGSGGVFAPSLFIGATIGGAFGLVVQQLPWFGHVDPGSYALVGMAAVVAASIHAPLTGTLILFELTRDYKVILPIMLAGVMALAVAQFIEPASIYTLKLLRRGIRLGTGDIRVLQRISVRDIPRVKAPLVRPSDGVDKLVGMMRTTTANDFVVVDEKGRLAGMVLGDDIRTTLLESDAIPLMTVRDLMRDDMPAVNLDETLDVVLDKFAGKPAHSLPVMDREKAGQVEELVTRAAVMNRYHAAVGEE